MTLRERIRQLRSSDKNSRSSNGSKKRSLKDRLRNDARTAERRVRDIDRKDVKEAIRRAGDTVDGVEASARGDPQDQGRNDPTTEAAEEAATMGAPVDASLEPTTTPQDMHQFASSGLDVDRQVTGAADEPAPGPGVGMGIDVGFGSGQPRDRAGGDAEPEPMFDMGVGFGGEPEGDSMADGVGFDLDFGGDDDGGIL